MGTHVLIEDHALTMNPTQDMLSSLEVSADVQCLARVIVVSGCRAGVASAPPSRWRRVAKSIKTFLGSPVKTLGTHCQELGKGGLPEAQLFFRPYQLGAG